MNDLNQQIQNYRRVFIQMHNAPDPDACASAVALTVYLGIKDIPVIYYSNTALSTDLQQVLLSVDCSPIRIYDDNKDKIVEELDIDLDKDLLILVDCQADNTNVHTVGFKHIACIDHHNITGEFPYVYKDIQGLGSCSVLLYKYLTPEILNSQRFLAEIIYYGLLTDLDGFTKGTNKETQQLKSSIEQLNLNFNYINQLSSGKYSIRDLPNVRQIFKDGVSDFNIFFSKTTECDDNLLGTLADFLMKFNGIDIVILCNERNDTIKLSVRSRLQAYTAGNIVHLFTTRGGDKLNGNISSGGCTIDKQEFVQRYGHDISRVIYNTVYNYIFC